jgi:hypothetical protein
LEEHLPLLAEIAIGLAGFSSIVVVFRRGSDSGSWEPGDVFRFRLMLKYSLIAAFFAVLPAAIMGVGLAGPYLWSSLSALLLSHVVLRTLQQLQRIRLLPADSLNTQLLYFLLAMVAMVCAIQALNIVGWLVPQGPGPYLLGVTWYTIYAGLMFYRLATAPFTRSGSGGESAA